MKSHYQLSDVAFEKEFSRAALDPKIFNHEAHLRLAWIHIKKYGVEAAVKNMTSQLQNYSEGLGFKDKYHETITIAAIRAVNHFMSESNADCFKGFIGQYPRLKTNFKDLLEQHYSTDIFSSSKARKKYLEPDLIPF